VLRLIITIRSMCFLQQFSACSSSLCKCSSFFVQEGFNLCIPFRVQSYLGRFKVVKLNGSNSVFPLTNILRLLHALHLDASLLSGGERD
jgi:hypothetical protein